MVNDVVDVALRLALLGAVAQRAAIGWGEPDQEETDALTALIVSTPSFGQLVVASIKAQAENAARMMKIAEEEGLLAPGVTAEEVAHRLAAALRERVARDMVIQ